MYARLQSASQPLTYAVTPVGFNPYLNTHTRTHIFTYEQTTNNHAQ